MNKRINIAKQSVLLLLFVGDSGWSPTKREVTDNCSRGKKEIVTTQRAHSRRGPQAGAGGRGGSPSFYHFPSVPGLASARSMHTNSGKCSPEKFIYLPHLYALIDYSALACFLLPSFITGSMAVVLFCLKKRARTHLSVKLERV